MAPGPVRMPRGRRTRPPTQPTAAAWTGHRTETRSRLRDDSLVAAKQQLADAVESLVGVLRAPDVVGDDRRRRPRRTSRST